MDSAFFLIKKLLSLLLMPAGLVLALAGLGILGWLRGRGWGRALTVAAFLLLLVLSLPVVSYHLLLPLESRAGEPADAARLAALGITDVVVLSGGVDAAPGPPPESLGASTLRRVLEGIRLWREVPGSRLVISGGSFRGGVPAAVLMARVAEQAGVPSSEIVLESDSRDTEDQARRLSAMLGSKPFALVTSAYHMPRTLWWLGLYGLKPVPAPVDFRTSGFRSGLMAWLPQAASLVGAQLALHEYLGRVWAQIKSWWLPMPPTIEERD